MFTLDEMCSEGMEAVEKGVSGVGKGEMGSPGMGVEMGVSGVGTV